MKRPLALTLTIALGVLGLSSSCGSPSGASTEVSHHITLGTMPSIDHLPIAIAEHLGVYDSLGLEVDLVPFYAPMERDVALQTGQIDGAVSDYTTALTQQAGGIDISLTIDLGGQFAFVVPQTSDVADWRTLAGRRIALSSNTVIEYATDSLLSGIAYTKVEVQRVPQRIEMLAQGEIDAAILPQPIALRAIAMGMRSLGAIPLQITGLVMQNSYLSEHADSYQLLIEGYNLAVEHFNALSLDERQRLVSEVLGIESGQSLEGLSLDDLERATPPEATALEPVVLWLKARGLVPEVYTPRIP